MNKLFILIFLGFIFFQNNIFAQSKKELLAKTDSLTLECEATQKLLDESKVNLGLLKNSLNSIEEKNNLCLKRTDKLILQLDSTTELLQIYKDSLNNAKKEVEIYEIHGVVSRESYGFDPDLDWIIIHDMHGDLKGYDIKVYTRTLNNSKYNIDCKGNVHLDRASYMFKTIKGKIVRSSGEFYNLAAPGNHLEEVWRPIELNTVEY